MTTGRAVAHVVDGAQRECAGRIRSAAVGFAANPAWWGGTFADSAIGAGMVAARRAAVAPTRGATTQVCTDLLGQVTRRST